MARLIALGPVHTAFLHVKEKGGGWGSVVCEGMHCDKTKDGGKHMHGGNPGTLSGVRWQERWGYVAL